MGVAFDPKMQGRIRRFCMIALIAVVVARTNHPSPRDSICGGSSPTHPSRHITDLTINCPDPSNHSKG